jgi:putative membrane protein|tara:strand:- start:286 stop:711 length:426 start_codon:yes stop_codon:yes gene_type:complete
MDLKMDGAIQSFLSGIPFLLTHFGVTIVMLVVGAFIYIKITSHDEMALIRDGNNAAAVSLSGAILGLAIPLAFCMANSVNVYDIVIWGLVTLVIQLVTFWIIDLWLRDLSRKIEDGQVGTAILLASVKLAVASINAAAISG